MRCHLNIFSTSTGHKWEQKAGRGGGGVYVIVTTGS